MRSLLNTILLYVLGIMDQNMEYNSTTSIHGEQIVEQFARMVNEDCDRTPTKIIQIVTIKEIERRLRYTKDSYRKKYNQ